MIDWDMDTWTILGPRMGEGAFVERPPLSFVMNASPIKNHIFPRRGKVPPPPRRPLPPLHPRSAFISIHEGAAEHESHNWTVLDDLLVPTHELERCVTCRVWVGHARECSRHCADRFGQARADAARDALQDTIRGYEEQIANSTRFGEIVMGWIEGKNKQLAEKDEIIDRLRTSYATTRDDWEAAFEAREDLEQCLFSAEKRVRALQRQLRAVQDAAQDTAQPERPLRSVATIPQPAFGEAGPSLPVVASAARQSSIIEISDSPSEHELTPELNNLGKGGATSSRKRKGKAKAKVDSSFLRKYYAKQVGQKRQRAGKSYVGHLVVPGSAGHFRA